MDTIDQESTGFELVDDKLAEWAVQKIKEARSDTAKWKAHFDAQLAAISKSNDETVAFFTGALGRFFGTVPHHVTDTQEKYELPGATLIRKKQQPEFKFDDDKLLDYFDASGYADYVKTERSPKWGDFKKNTTIKDGELVDNETGEIVGCVSVITRPDTFNVKIKEGNHAI